MCVYIHICIYIYIYIYVTMYFMCIYIYICIFIIISFIVSCMPRFNAHMYLTMARIRMSCESAEGMTTAPS